MQLATAGKQNLTGAATSHPIILAFQIPHGIKPADAFAFAVRTLRDCQFPSSDSLFKTFK